MREDGQGLQQAATSAEDARRRAAWSEQAGRDGHAVVAWQHLAPASASADTAQMVRIAAYLRWRCWAEAVLSGLQVTGQPEVVVNGMVMGEAGPVRARPSQAIQMVEVVASVSARLVGHPADPQVLAVASAFTTELAQDVTAERMTVAGRTVAWPGHILQ
ncbi:hypothetical protein [Kitasatospora sp. NPDC085464]|uniref:hypothetical protein n=1 Tax=Kitasatospora sp. NPDC085464 TaxID=3364063 RepID=UPI0037C6DF0B